MFNQLSIETRDLVVRLPPGTVGLFEPVSAIMFLNVADSEFERMHDELDRAPGSLLEVFLHEAFHCFQTYSSGYQFKQLYDLVGALGAAARPFASLLSLDMAKTLGASMLDRIYPCAPWKVQAWLSGLTRSWYRAGRLAHLEQLRAKAHAKTLARLFFPKISERVQRVHQRSAQHGRDGLSALDVVEGSAALYARKSCTQQTPSALAFLHELEGSAPTHAALLRTAHAAHGETCMPLLLPAAALALRYERPGDAIMPLLQRLRDAVRDDVLAAARRIASELPDVDAGERLGTASDYAARLTERARLRPLARVPPRTFDVQMRALRQGSWNIDELALLSDVNASSSIPVGSLGFRIVTKDGKRGFSDGFAPLLNGVLMLGGGLTVSEQLRRLTEDDVPPVGARDTRALLHSLLGDGAKLLARMLAGYGAQRAGVALLESWTRLNRRLARGAHFFSPLLATSLLALGEELAQQKNAQAAYAAVSESSEILRELACNEPAFIPEYAFSMCALGERSLEIGERDLGRLALSLAADRFRAMAGARPQPFLPHLAATLSRLADVARREHEPALGLTHSLEAASVYRNLCSSWPKRFCSQLEAELTQVRALLSDASDPDEECRALRTRAAQLLATCELSSLPSAAALDAED